MKRVALFGGTFDPIHRGHVFIAERAQVQCQLDEIVFVPCWQSPHKLDREMAASAQDRVAMVALATEGLSWARVSQWEVQRATPSYSWQTAERWRREVLETSDELFWILGADQWSALRRWARADYLAELLRFIVFPRDGTTPREQDGLDACFLSDAMAISGTQIRTQSRVGESIEEEVGVAVANYILEKRLYACA